MSQDEEIARLHRFIMQLSGRLFLAYEVLANLAEKRKPKMAIMPGMPCIACEKKPARDDSHYCSKACSDAFVAMDGPIQCAWCSAEFDTTAKAKRAKWKDIQPDPEGISYNWSGVCPKCQPLYASSNMPLFTQEEP